MNIKLKEHKLTRIEQMKSFEFFRLKSVETNKDFQCGCTRLDGTIDTVNNIDNYKSWINCSAQRCTVAVYGESKQSLIRKRLKPNNG